MSLEGSLILLPSLPRFHGDDDQTRDAEEGEQQSNGHSPNEGWLFEMMRVSVLSENVSKSADWGIIPERLLFERSISPTVKLVKDCGIVPLRWDTALQLIVGKIKENHGAIVVEIWLGDPFIESTEMAGAPCRNPVHSILSEGGIDPFKRLVFRSNHSKLPQSPSSAGMFPVIELFPSFKMARLDKWPSEDGGIKPERLLELKSKVSRFTKLDSASGNSPTKLFMEKTKVFKLVSLRMVSTGNSPEKLLLEISIRSSTEQASMLSGTTPEKSFMAKSNSTRVLHNSPIWAGNAP
nr:hypothetical protein CDL12_19998 [Ipomoea batatas]